MKTQAEIDAANQYHAYQKGWIAGACVRAMDPAAAHHADPLIRAAYNQGYADGRRTRNLAMQMAATKYGHTLSVLRLMDTEGEHST